MSKVRVIEVDGDRYVRLRDVLHFASENESAFLRAGENQEANVMKAIGTVFGQFESIELTGLSS